MKAIITLVSLLLVLGIVSVLVKKQLSASSTATPPSGAGVQLQDAPAQVKQQVEGLMQKPRETQEDK